jgi:hypothetical protein
MISTFDQAALQLGAVAMAAQDNGQQCVLSCLRCR